MTKRILVIDHDPAFAQVVEDSYASIPVTFDICQQGDEGFAKALETLPDLIILCLELPDMSGYMTCKKLRDSEATQLIKIILTSSTAKQADFEKHKRLRGRADTYLQKPITKGVLLTETIALLELDHPIPSFEEELQELQHHVSDLDGTMDPAELEELDPPEETPANSMGQDQLRLELENKRREIDYLRKEIEAFKPFMKELEENRSSLEQTKAKVLEKERTILALQTEGSNQYTDHKKQIQQFKNQLSQRETELGQQKTDLESLRAETQKQAALISALQSQTSEQDLHVKKIRDLSKKLSDAEEDKNASVLELGNLKKAHGELIAQIEAQKTEMANLSNQLDSSKNSATLLSSQLSDTQTQHTLEISKLKDELRQAQTLFQEFQIKGEQESQNAGKIAHQLREQEEQNQKYQLRIAELEAAAEAFSDEIQERDQLEQKQKLELQSLNEAFAQSESKAASLLSKNQEFQENIGQLKREKQDLSEKLAKKETEQRESLDGLRARFEESHEALFIDFQGEKLEWTQENARLQQTIETLRADLECAQDDLIQTRQKYETQLAQLQKNESHSHQQHEEQITQLSQANDALSAAVESKQKEIGELELKARDYQEKLDLSSQKYLDQIANLQKAHNEALEDHQSRIKELEAKCNELMDQAGKMDASKEKLKATLIEVNRLRLGHETLKNRIEKARRTLESGLQELLGSTEELAFEED